mmetsp:Transcript_26177/g.77456  ORF Transcript_26177/g.77456 Transcript_26177/m.77456 type:complete len:207 (-) Transcript_26177:50-670(-)
MESFSSPSIIAQVVVVIVVAAFPTMAFSTANLACSTRPPRFSNKRLLFAVPDERNDTDEEFSEDEDDEEEEIKPYGNRSLAWTKRYRRLNPYEKVRRRVLKFGHRSKADWDECVASGLQGQYVPARPDEMFASEWTSWEEFLGLMRPYEETRNLAVNVLGLKSFDTYILFVRQNPKRAEGLRIPLRPDLVYKSEWVDEESFFGEKN